MRCLWITRQDPRPADSGELIYTLGLLKALAAQPGMDITVLAHHPNPRPCARGNAATDDPQRRLEQGKASYENGDPSAAVAHLQAARQDPRLAEEAAGLAERITAEIEGAPKNASRFGGRGQAVNWELHGTIPSGRLRSLASTLPGDAFRLGNPVQRAELKRLLEKKWDWIVIDQAACAWALGMIGKEQKVVYLAHNHEATVRREVAADGRGSLPMRMALKLDATKYARMEAALCRRADLISAITPRDAEAFKKENPGKPVCVLPPGYTGSIPDGPPRPITEESPRTVLLAGTFEWLAKRRNLESFLKAAAAPFQEAKIAFQVAGKADPEWFAALARQYPWASFAANVPSMAPYLDQARIGLIPEALGGGFKLKALDYIFRGLPLASVEAALSGVPVDPATEAIAAPDPESLALAVAGKIDDLAFLNHAASRAVDACRHAFHWEDRGELLGRALGNPDAFRS
ncbi:glycosyltransferase [Luteolibacter flavescens]|uniref:Glycosyltransferase n=1 Tax=Luteolibacter flavescens TaxID=1859460 RepID=A0ABT3FS63_9BACT|nr:glycosyltransferase [Luteolibacter flavescens]MCW1885820.1 glycosyltransferase [Luteolibacter flavescens]